MPESTPVQVDSHQPDRSSQSPPGSAVATQAKVLAFVNQKGGTGKTTITQNLAICLARQHGQRVLCLDLDPQGNLGQGLAAGQIKATKTADRLLLVPGASIAEYIVPIRPSVDLIPNHYVQEMRNAVERMPLSDNPLRRHLNRVTSQYDYILIDTPAGLSRTTQFGIDAADQIVLVISCGIYALRGASALVAWMEDISAQQHRSPPAIRVVINNYDERRRFDRDLRQQVEYIFGEGLYQTQIRTSVKVVEAAAQSLAVIELAQNNPSAMDFKQLGCEVLGLPVAVSSTDESALPEQSDSEPQPGRTRLKLVS
jgi:chromosome partitioning protein